ncbi:acyltransferase family protein [Paenibacillus faecis]|uniref:acyltransferase family protein n=1 Tax=Paenibacillus faecis TaxID=862114 RepID=UPI001BCCEFF2|nr:acyltransferase family protein [Paenibacillus faecis]
MSDKKTRLFFLDFVRAVSMLMIVIYHFNMSLLGHSVTARDVSMIVIPGDYLGIGVSVFLILSGAALMYTYQNGLSLKVFLKKRFLSIYPMFWIAYIIVFFYMFYTYLSINHQAPKAKFLLTILGFDGYLLWTGTNYYIIGEWFLGLIIILYIIFPLLRRLIDKFPVFLLVIIVIAFIVTVENYPFRIPILYNPIIRLPEFLLGMYFIKYIKHVKFYQFVIALCFAYPFMIVDGIPLNPIYKFTIIGLSLFVVLSYIGQCLKSDRLRKPILFISKYSYAIFLVHHVVIEQMMIRFNGRSLTVVETHMLFFIMFIFILLISKALSSFTDIITEKLKAISFKRRTKVITESIDVSSHYN